jgi:Tol biopolymer transport system component
VKSLHVFAFLGSQFNCNSWVFIKNSPKQTTIYKENKNWHEKCMLNSKEIKMNAISFGLQNKKKFAGDETFHFFERLDLTMKLFRGSIRTSKHLWRYRRKKLMGTSKNGDLKKGLKKKWKIIGGLGGLVTLISIIFFGIDFWANEIVIRQKVGKLDQLTEIAVRNEARLDILLTYKFTKMDDLLFKRTLYAKIKEIKFNRGFNVISGTYYSSPGQVFLINRHGENRRSLPFEGESVNADWSPDTSKIVFQGKEKGKDNYGIYVYDLKTNKIHTLTKNCDNIDPIWTSDGMDILFCSNRDHPNNKDIYDLCRMNSDGSNFKVILRNTDIDKHNPYLSLCLPSINPNDNCIGFSTLYKKSWDLWIMHPSKKSTVKRIQKWGHCRMKFNPTSDNEIVFATDRREQAGISDKKYKTYTDIIVAKLNMQEGNISIDLSSKVNLTKMSFPTKYPNCPSDNFPDWSYDGKKIIFSSTKIKRSIPEESDWIIHVINKDGTGRSELAGKKIKAIYPNW